MSRVLSQKEIDNFLEWANDKGLITLGAPGESNANLLVNQVVETNRQQMNRETLSAAATVLGDKLIFLTPVQHEHNKLWNSLEPNDQGTVTKWFARQKLAQDGDSFLENFNTVVGFLKARKMAITFAGLDTALSNSVNNSPSQLHWKPAPTQTEQFGRHSGKKFNNQDNVSLTLDQEQSDTDYVGGRLNHARNPSLQPKTPTPLADSIWQQKAELVRGDNHAETAQLRKIFVTKAGLKINAATTETDWEQTFNARVLAEKQIRRDKEGRF